MQHADSLSVPLTRLRRRPSSLISLGEGLLQQAANLLNDQEIPKHQLASSGFPQSVPPDIEKSNRISLFGQDAPRKRNSSLAAASVDVLKSTTALLFDAPFKLEITAINGDALQVSAKELAVRSQERG